MPSRWNFVVIHQWRPTRRAHALSQQCVPALAMMQSRGATPSPNDDAPPREAARGRVVPAVEDVAAKAAGQRRRLRVRVEPGADGDAVEGARPRDAPGLRLHRVAAARPRHGAHRRPEFDFSRQPEAVDVALEVGDVGVEREVALRAAAEPEVGEGRDVLGRDHARALVGVREDAADGPGALRDDDVRVRVLEERLRRREAWAAKG